MLYSIRTSLSRSHDGASAHSLHSTLNCSFYESRVGCQLADYSPPPVRAWAGEGALGDRAQDEGALGRPGRGHGELKPAGTGNGELGPAGMETGQG